MKISSTCKMSSQREDFVHGSTQSKKGSAQAENTSRPECQASAATEAVLRSDDAPQNAVVSSTVDIAESQNRVNDTRLPAHGSCVRYFVRDESHMADDIPSTEKHLGLSEILESSRLELGPADTCHDLSISSNTSALLFQSAASEKDNEEAVHDEEAINTITLTAEEMEKLNTNHRIEILTRSPGGTDQKLFFVLDEKDTSGIFSEELQHSSESDPLAVQTSLAENYEGIMIQRSLAAANRRSETEGGSTETGSKVAKHVSAFSRMGTPVSVHANHDLERPAADHLQNSTLVHREQGYAHEFHDASEMPFYAAADEALCAEQISFSKRHASLKTGASSSIMFESRHYEPPSAERSRTGDPSQKIIVTEHWNSRLNHLPAHEEEEILNLDTLNTFPHARPYVSGFTEPPNSAFFSRARSGSDFPAETSGSFHADLSTFYQSDEDLSRLKFFSNRRDSSRFQQYVQNRQIAYSDMYYPVADTCYDYVQPEAGPVSCDDSRYQYPLLLSSRAEGNVNAIVVGNGMQSFCREDIRPRYPPDVKLVPLSYSKDSNLYPESGENFHDAPALGSATYMYVRPMRGRGLRGQGPRARTRGRRSTAGRQYLQHRLLWARYTGRSPEALSRVLQTIQDRCGIRPTNQSTSLNWDRINQETAVHYPVHQLEAVPTRGQQDSVGENERPARVPLPESITGFLKPASIQGVLYHREGSLSANVSSGEKDVEEGYSPRHEDAVSNSFEKKRNERSTARENLSINSPQVPSDKRLPANTDRVIEENLSATGSVRKDEAGETVAATEMTNAGDAFISTKFAAPSDSRERKREESHRLADDTAVVADITSFPQTKNADDKADKESAGDTPGQGKSNREASCALTADDTSTVNKAGAHTANGATNSAEDRLGSSVGETAKFGATGKEDSATSDDKPAPKKEDARNTRDLPWRENIAAEKMENSGQGFGVDCCQRKKRRCGSGTENVAIGTNDDHASLDTTETNSKENCRGIDIAVTGAAEAEDMRTPQYVKDEKPDEQLEIPPTPFKKPRFGNRVHSIETDWRKGNKTSYPTLPDEKQRDISASCYQIEQEHVSKLNDKHSFAEPVLDTEGSEAVVKVVCESKVCFGSFEKKASKNIDRKNRDVRSASAQPKKKNVRRSLFPSPVKESRSSGRVPQHEENNHDNSTDVTRNGKKAATPMTVDAGQEVASLSGDTYPSVSQFLQAAATGGININIHVSNDVIKEPPARDNREDSNLGKSGTEKRDFLTGKRPGGEQNADELQLHERPSKRPHYSEVWLGQCGQNQTAPDLAHLQVQAGQQADGRNIAAFGSRYVDYNSDGLGGSELQSSSYPSSTPEALDTYYTSGYIQQYAWPVYTSAQAATSRYPPMFERSDPFSPCAPSPQRPQHAPFHEVISDQYLLALESAVRASQELENKDLSVKLNAARKKRKGVGGQDNERDFLVVETRKHRWFLGDSPLRAYPPYPGGEANTFYVSPDTAHKLQNLQPYGDMYPHHILKSDAFMGAGQCPGYGSSGVLGAQQQHHHPHAHEAMFAEDRRGLDYKKWQESRNTSLSYVGSSQFHSNGRYVPAEYASIAQGSLTKNGGSHGGLTYADNQGDATRLKLWHRLSQSDSSGSFAMSEQPADSLPSQQASLLDKPDPDLEGRLPKSDCRTSTEPSENFKKAEPKGLANP